MQQRALGPFQVSAIGLGCMNLSHAYGAPVSAEQGERVLLAVMTAGVMHLDVPMRESGAWSATQASVNEGLPPELQMRFAGVTVHAYET